MISVRVTRAFSGITVPSSAIRNAATTVCRKEKVSAAELSIILVNDRTIRTLNKKFLRHDYVTDVITFPMDREEVNAEIYINGQQAKRQAKEHRVSIMNEVLRLVVHGTLHALGYDDTTGARQKRMLAVQERYVSRLSLYK